MNGLVKSIVAVAVLFAVLKFTNAGDVLAPLGLKFLLSDEAVLEQIVDASNKLGPQRIAKDLMFLGMQAKGKSLQANYKVTNIERKQLRGTDAKEKIGRQVVAQACASATFRIVFDRGMQMEYVYLDKNDQSLATYVVKPEQCV